MPKIHYTLTINGEIDVDNAIHMLDEEGQLLLIEEELNSKIPEVYFEADEINFEIVDD